METVYKNCTKSFLKLFLPVQTGTQVGILDQIKKMVGHLVTLSL